MPRLSILIPCLGGSAEFDATLVSVLENRPARCEVLVLHTAPYDDPYRLAGEVQFLRCERARSLVELVNAGIEAAQSDVVHVLACGLEASESWTEPALPHFDDDEVAAVIPEVTSRELLGITWTGVRLSAGGRRYLARGTRTPVACGPTLAAGFYRRDVLAALGGFDKLAGDELADVDLALNLHALKLRAVVEQNSKIAQVHDPLAASEKRQFGRGLAAERLFRRNATRIGLPLALAAHPLALLADLVQLRLLSLIGRAIAWATPGDLAHWQSRVAAASVRLADSRQTEQKTLPLPARPATAAERPCRKAA